MQLLLIVFAYCLLPNYCCACLLACLLAYLLCLLAMPRSPVDLLASIWRSTSILDTLGHFQLPLYSYFGNFGTSLWRLLQFGKDWGRQEILE